MHTLSARQKDKIQRLINKFSEDWEINITNFPTIRHKKKKGLQRVLQKFFGRKHRVIALYYFINKAYSENSEYMKYWFPIDHDNTPVNGVPLKFSLDSSWNISDDDLKYLYEGPLVDQNGIVLVQPYTTIEKVKRLKPYFATVATVLGGTVSLVKLWQML
jgi:hypothetical protein